MHNFLPNNAKSSGIFTVNSDGSVAVSGTTTEYNGLAIFQGQIPIKKGKYIFSGYGGTAANGNINLNIGGTNYWVEESAIEITLSADSTINYAVIQVNSGQTVNFTCYPMLRLATDTDSTYQPYSMTSQELTPYAQSQSNENFLDNPFFTINSRGLSSYTTKWSYCVDRWYDLALDSVVVNNGSITLNCANTSETNRLIAQYFDQSTVSRLNGKTVTISCIDSNGDLISATGKVVLNSGYNFIRGWNDTTYISLSSTSASNLHFRLQLFGTATSTTVKAVKLELGTVSTLANDTAPDYRIELAKCRASTGDSSDTYANHGAINVGTPNPNLLDNPWFTINQRGITSWSNESGGYSVDRWKHDGNATGSITNGVYTCNTPTYQNWEDDRITPLLGKTVTLSWILSDGSIGFETKTLPSTLTSQYVWPFTNPYVALTLKSGNVSQAARIIAGVAVKAVKLELGSQSTLALDTAPNYATELLKCQRYFYRLYNATQNNYPVVSGYTASALIHVASFKLPVTMRVKPTISKSSGLRVRVMDSTGIVVDNKLPTAINITPDGNNDIACCIFTFASGDSTSAGNLVPIVVVLVRESETDGAQYIDFLAEL